MLRTVPAGADIFEGMERLGSSPLPLKRPRSDTPLFVTIKHSGYKEVSRDIVPDRDRDMEVVLVPKPKAVATANPKLTQSKKGQPAQPVAPAAPQQPKRVSDLRNPFE